MSGFSKETQAKRKGGKPPPRRIAQRGSTLKVQPKPMRKHSLTNARAVAWRDEYLPLRAAFLADRPDCEMRITTPAICTGRATEVQHMIQVSLDPSVENLLDVTHWLAACHECNTWAGPHLTEARALGVELSPQQRDAIREAA